METNALVPSASTSAAEAGLSRKSALRARELVTNVCQIGLRFVLFLLLFSLSYRRRRSLRMFRKLLFLYYEFFE